MPRRDDISTILLPGAGPIVIGQACEFDYSGTQALRVLKQEGYRVVLVNSNPATIMTDPDFADATYIEPLTAETIANDITRVTPACFEPALDYVVTKIPRWDFSRFPDADDAFGVQMKSVREVMAIGRTFKESFQKALRSLESGRAGFGADGRDEADATAMDAGEKLELAAELRRRLAAPGDSRIFDLRLAMQCGIDTDELNEITGMDPWFLNQMREIVDLEAVLRTSEFPC